MIEKRITFCGQAALIACDEECHKAWGRSSRPRRHLGGCEDNYVYLSDGELGAAPQDPGTYEGADGKPQEPSDRLNKWCCRECERCYLSHPGESHWPPELPDLATPIPNMR